ncbi:hypothetical protein Dsin_027683 [Dipteronia sinensis]|uniref:Transmembrane protein n=1 Tax=Dipteronia sinensis TaxID=43782 RepID=A0AAD9ZQD7_9ROSI|nr:hypothetical protein Dsin_027683 [Dipteronia sinensis]
MEENENENPNSMIIKTISFACFLSSDPLFSTISTLYILILLYFPPPICFKVVFSPVLNITLILLLTLLRFGATQRYENSENNENREKIENKRNDVIDADQADCNYKSETLHEDHHNWVIKCKESGFDPDPIFEEKFVEWNVRAPLDVIYEAYYEGEECEEEEDDQQQKHDENKDPNKDPTRFGIERYPSLSLYYPDSDSDASSDGDFMAVGDWGSPENVRFRWEDEDREGLIEIALDGLDNGLDNGSYNNKKKRDFDYLVESFHGEEENNLIEIDISPAKFEGKWRFSGGG